jgi:hypothetical protein
MDDKRQKLYELAKSKGVPMPDYATYNQSLDDPNKRQKFYSAMQTNGVPMPDYNTFQSVIGTQNKVAPVLTTAPVPGGGVSTMTVPESTVKNVKSIGNEFTSASDKLRRGSYIAGAAQAGNAALNAGLAPLQMADAKIREALPRYQPQPTFNPFSKATVGNVVNTALDAAGAIATGVGKVYEWGTKAGLGYASLLDKNFFTSPENAKEIREEVPKLGETVGSIVGLPEARSVLKTTNKVGAKLSDVKNQAYGTTQWMKAFPAKIKEINAKQVVETGSPFFAKSFRDKPLDKSKGAAEPVRQVYERGREIKQQIFNDRMNPAIEHYKETPVNIVESIKTPVLETLTEPKKWANPKKVDAIRNYIEKDIPNEMNLGQMRDFVTELNADTKGYRKASPAEQATMFNADPTIALKIDLADALKETMLNKVSELGEPNVKKFRQEYGAVAGMTDMAYRNIVQSERQLPRFMGGSSPAKSGMMLTGELMLMLHNPPAAIIGGIGAIARDYTINRGLKNPTIERAINAWTKTSLKPSEYKFVPSTKVRITAKQPPKGMTETAVDKGSNFTIDEAINRWNERGTISKEVEGLIAKGDVQSAQKRMFDTQIAREEVEGFIAKKLGKPHEAMTPADIEKILAELRGKQ